MPFSPLSYPAWLERINARAAFADVSFSFSSDGKDIIASDETALISYNPNTGMFSGVRCTRFTVKEFLTYFVANDNLQTFLQDWSRTLNPNAD